MISHNKRYRFEFQRWGKDWQGKSYFKCEVTECDTLDDVSECIAMTKELYGDVIRPDENAKCSKNSKSKRNKWKNYTEDDWIYDDTHFWWGYAVFDFEDQKIIAEGGEGFQSEEHPMKSLRYLDLYFRGDDEIPKDYKWDDGEYDGWLQFRWGNGENAIEKVRERRAKAEAATKRKAEAEKNSQPIVEEEASEEDIAAWLVNNDADDLEAEYDRIADKELVKYNMDKYGW